MSARFLMVDDDEAVRRALARLVSAYGEPVLAGSAREARRHLAEGRPWRAFVIDLGLPDGSGLDVLAEARASSPKAPALVLTGHTSGSEINAAYDLGADYVVKPIETARLQRFLRAAADATSDEAGAPAKRLPETLTGCFAHLRALFAARQDVRTRYAIGQTVAAIKAGRGTFGAGAVTVVARALGQDVPTLYRHAAVAERLRPAEVEAWLARRGAKGQEISWSHLVALASVDDPAFRERLVDRILADGLSVREAVAVLGEKDGS